MRVAVFNTKPYDRQFLDAANNAARFYGDLFGGAAASGHGSLRKKNRNRPIGSIVHSQAILRDQIFFQIGRLLMLMRIGSGH